MPKKFGEVLIPKSVMSRPRSSCFTAKDVAEMFSFSNAKVVYQQVRDGFFPAPDRRYKTLRGVEGAPKLGWTLDTILKEAKRRIHANAEHDKERKADGIATVEIEGEWP
jgi:hypothetical protein